MVKLVFGDRCLCVLVLSLSKPSVSQYGSVVMDYHFINNADVGRIDFNQFQAVGN